ncbi:MAG TPA: homoserine O-succinyltransferase [Micropepsaceae bacterium]|nr:homoserine O-succinyltransferase [Micropepsaceae bacterium]
MAVFSADKPDDSEGALTIGLVNNMPDAALEATEQQFTNLLNAAAGSLTVRLRLFALAEVPRGKAGRERIRRLYADFRALDRSRLDGLIVTGAEPIAPDLKDEPYWSSLIQVLRWAEMNAVPTIWSCLAAHAIVLHLSGIRRRRLEEKCSGLFSFEKVEGHPFADGLPSKFLMPHSRYNGLAEEDLAAAGFTILSRSSEAGVDMFVKDGEGPFLFVQGHPEYDAHTLLREYKRDIRRFLKREMETYPKLPVGYFDQEAAARFERFREEALKDRSEDVLDRLSTAAAEPILSNVWRATAVRLYANWLNFLMLKKATVAARELALEFDHVRASKQALRP